MPDQKTVENHDSDSVQEVKRCGDKCRHYFPRTPSCGFCWQVLKRVKEGAECIDEGVAKTES